jgi:hypothetical protein
MVECTFGDHAARDLFHLKPPIKQEARDEKGTEKEGEGMSIKGGMEHTMQPEESEGFSPFKQVSKPLLLRVGANTLPNGIPSEKEP